MDSLIQYNNAGNAIKTAILQGQYEAAKGVNRIQLALYFSIGKYLSQHTRKGVWGEGALAAISELLLCRICCSRLQQADGSCYL